MYTYQIIVDHVNGERYPHTLFIEAEDKIQCAEQVNARFSNPAVLSYSMHELDKPLNSSEALSLQLDQLIIKANATTRIMEQLLKSYI